MPNSIYQHDFDDPTLNNLHTAMTYIGSIPHVRVSANSAGAGDAFGRLRVSNPVTLFDSANRYKENSKFSTATAGSGATTYDANQSTVNMTVTGTGSVTAESRRVLPYQPGKSLLILNTFVMTEPQAGLTQRVGYFSAENGIFVETVGTTVNLVIRKKINGTMDETTEKVSQANWNGDKLNGAGASSKTLDFSKAQIFWIDIEWLGVGSVRCGFVVDGQFILCHTFNHANAISSVYMTTASLPIRYEITSTGPTATLKRICSSVVSEGGYEQRTKQWSATRTTSIASTAVASGWSPIVSIRMTSGRTDSVIIPGDINIVGDGNNSIYEWALIRNATITGGTWTTHAMSGGNVQYNVDATALTLNSGTVEASSIFTSSNQSKSNAISTIGYNWDLQLGRDVSGNSDTLTLAVRHLATGGQVFGSLAWNDLL